MHLLSPLFRKPTPLCVPLPIPSLYSVFCTYPLICWHSPNLLSLPCDPLILNILCLVFMVTSELMTSKHIFYFLFWISGQNIQKPPVSQRAPAQHIRDGPWPLPEPPYYFLLSVESPQLSKPKPWELHLIFLPLFSTSNWLFYWLKYFLRTSSVSEDSELLFDLIGPSYQGIQMLKNTNLLITQICAQSHRGEVQGTLRRSSSVPGPVASAFWTLSSDLSEPLHACLCCGLPSSVWMPTGAFQLCTCLACLPKLLRIHCMFPRKSFKGPRWPTPIFSFLAASTLCWISFRLGNSSFSRWRNWGWLLWGPCTASFQGPEQCWATRRAMQRGLAFLGLGGALDHPLSVIPTGLS